MPRRETPRPELRCPTCQAEVERFCPWCGRDIRDADSSLEPLKAPKGFLFHKRCKRCRGGLMYPMQWCPWCGRSQAFTWGYYQFQNICPHCDRGVDDWTGPAAARPAPGAPAARGVAAQGVALPRAAPSRRFGRLSRRAQGDRDRPPLRAEEAAQRRGLVEHAHGANPPRAGSLFPLSSLELDAQRPVSPRLRRSAQGVPGGGRTLGGLRAPPRGDDVGGLRERVREHPPPGRLRRNVSVLRDSAGAAARAVRRVRPQAEGRAGVREVSRPARLRAQPQGLALRLYLSPGPPLRDAERG